MSLQRDELSKRFGTLLAEFLENHPGLNGQWLSDSLVQFPRADEAGFDVEVVLEDDMIVVNSLGIQEHFHSVGEYESGEPEELARSAIAFLQDMLSPAMRIREGRAGRSAYRWILERKTREGWHEASLTTSLIFNFFGKRSERILQNRHLEHDAG